jgi:hypothetical protein
MPQNHIATGPLPAVRPEPKRDRHALGRPGAQPVALYCAPKRAARDGGTHWAPDAKVVTR